MFGDPEGKLLNKIYHSLWERLKNKICNRDSLKELKEKVKKNRNDLNANVLGFIEDDNEEAREENVEILKYACAIKCNLDSSTYLVSIIALMIALFSAFTSIVSLYKIELGGKEMDIPGWIIIGLIIVVLIMGICVTGRHKHYIAIQYALNEYERKKLQEDKAKCAQQDIDSDLFIGRTRIKSATGTPFNDDSQ